MHTEWVLLKNNHYACDSITGDCNVNVIVTTPIKTLAYTIGYQLLLRQQTDSSITIN
jgi:hypothetical protein